MAFELEFTEEAIQDIREASKWYDSIKSGLGDDFLLSLEASVNHIQRNPLQYQIRYGKVRRVLLQRFPYQVIFVVNEQLIGVLGVIHTNRDPNAWQKRLK